MVSDDNIRVQVVLIKLSQVFALLITIHTKVSIVNREYIEIHLFFFSIGEEEKK